MTRELYPMDREDCLARFAAMEKRIATLEQALKESGPKDTQRERSEATPTNERQTP